MNIPIKLQYPGIVKEKSPSRGIFSLMHKRAGPAAAGRWTGFSMYDRPASGHTKGEVITLSNKNNKKNNSQNNNSQSSSSNSQNDSQNSRSNNNSQNKSQN